MSHQQYGQQPPQQNAMEDGERPPPSGPILQLAGAGASDAAQMTGGPKCGRWTLQQLRATEAIVPAQYGSNRFASQKKMTGFGSPRDVSGKHIHNLWEEYMVAPEEGEGGEHNNPNQAFQQQQGGGYGQQGGYQQQGYQQQQQQQQGYGQQQQYMQDASSVSRNPSGQQHYAP